MEKNHKIKTVPLLAILIIILAIVLFVLPIVLMYTQRSSRPSTLSSKGVGSVAEKVGTIGRYVDIPNKVEEIEYYCTFSRSSIGPSNYACVVAVKVAPSDINIWLEKYHYTKSDNNNDDDDDYVNDQLLSSVENIKGISLSGEIWRHSSKPELYRNGTNSIIVFRAEGILIIKYYT